MTNLRVALESDYAALSCGGKICQLSTIESTLALR